MKAANFSLRIRLLVSLMSLLGLAIVAQAALTYRAFLAESDDIFDYQMVQMAQLLVRGDDVLQSLPTGVQDDDDEDLRLYLQIWEEGTLEYASDRNQLMPRQAQTGFADVDMPAGKLRIHTERRGDLQVQVGQALAARHEVAGEMALETAWPLAAVAVLMLMATALIASLALRPLTRLGREVAARKPGDLAALDTRGLPREILPLVAETNALMVRMESAYEQQRRFVSDAAHELRTPLAALLLQNEAIRRAEDPDAMQQALQQQKQGIQRASRLVEQLLMLARQEAQQEAAGDIFLQSLLMQLTEAFHPIASARNIRFVAHVTHDVQLRGQPESLYAALSNLLDNAIKYTPEGGEVDLRTAKAADGRLQVRIEDSGPGLAPEVLERVFDRFYRVPGSTGQGSGLGLAIARQAAASLGATLVLESRPEGGLVAILTLP